MVDKLRRGTWMGGEGAELSLNDLLLQGNSLKAAKLQCFQLSDQIILVWACRKELSHQTLLVGFRF